MRRIWLLASIMMVTFLFVGPTAQGGDVEIARRVSVSEAKLAEAIADRYGLVLHSIELSRARTGAFAYQLGLENLEVLFRASERADLSSGAASASLAPVPGFSRLVRCDLTVMVPSRTLPLWLHDCEDLERKGSGPKVFGLENSFLERSSCLIDHRSRHLR